MGRDFPDFVKKNMFDLVKKKGCEMRKINRNKMVPGYGVELWSIAKSHKQGSGEFELIKNWGVREEEDVTLWG